MMQQIETLLNLLIENLPFALIWVGILWIIYFVNAYVFRYRLNYLGIYPRKWFGIFGIFCSPFLHANFNHLFFNSIPLLILIDFISLNGIGEFYVLSFTIILLSGLLIWLFGRQAIHIGASSVIMGYMGYLLLNAYYQPGIISLVLAIVALYYFGYGFLMALFAPKEKSSWEGHIFGALAGAITAYLSNLPNFLHL